MNEDLHLASDLALILISAGIITLIFRWLKQPLILGYIVAGFLVGPHFDLFPNVVEMPVVEQWSELGIIFLLFALGLEFSFKKLMRVGSSALVTAGTLFLGMFVVGLMVGKAIGWTTMECVFLGGMLSMSSTTIIIKAFDDLGLKKQPFTTIVFGTLVVEDLLAVLLMVLLSTAAVSKQFAGAQMVGSLAKLGFFLILWFLVGIFVLPTFLKKAHRLLNDETLLVLSLGLCFLMVVLAGYAGFSTALGAFVMGSILAETLEGERIEKLIKGIKDLFGAVFFVSVGMMVDPVIILQYWKPILFLTLTVIMGISFFATGGVLLSGRPLKVAVNCGFSMVQIGEFAFIIAGLGRSLGVMRDFIYPVVVAVSVITTFFTPYFIRLSNPFADWLEKVMPKKWLRKLEAYASGSLAVNRKSDWKKLLQSYVIRIVLYSVLLIAINLLFSRYVSPFLEQLLAAWPNAAVKWLCVGATLLLMSPFLFGLAIYKGDTRYLFEKLWHSGKANRGPLVALILFRDFLAVLFFAAVFFHYFAFSHWVLLACVLSLAAMYFLSKSNMKRFHQMEERFFLNLNQKEDMEKQLRPMRTTITSHLSGKDIRLENVLVSPDSAYIGKRLKEIPFKQEYGVNIMKITRGSRVINLPSGEEFIYPYDSLLAFGTPAQMDCFMNRMESKTAPEVTYVHPVAEVKSFVMDASNINCNKSLALSDFRQRGIMVIGVERGAGSFMNPAADFVFKEGDLVWIIKEK